MTVQSGIGKTSGGMLSMKTVLILLVLIGSVLATEAQACQKYFSNVQDNVGNLVSGVAVAVTIYNTETIATIYSDAACASTTPNPMTSNADGSYSFYAQDGHYSLGFIKDGYTIASVLDIAIIEPFGANVKSVSEFSNPDNICDPTNGAIAQTGVIVRTIYVNTAVACTLDATAPVTLSWVFLGKGSVTISSGKTLTMNGRVTTLVAHNVFLGAGTSSFGYEAGPDPMGKLGYLPVTYSTSMAIASLYATTFVITPTNAVAFAVSTINTAIHNRRIRINVRNPTGGALGAGTFPCCKIGAAWTQPATGFNRSMDLEYNGTQWEEVGRTAADVSN